MSLPDHLLKSVEETRNKTSAKLAQLFQIPAREHKAALDFFVSRLDQYFLGNDHHRPEDIVAALFQDIFPSVYTYVLSTWQDPSSQQLGQSHEEFRECLRTSYNQVGGGEGVSQDLL